MGIGVFTPTLIIIGSLCALALIVSGLNFVSLLGVKARMVTRNSQDLFGERLLSALTGKIEAAAKENRVTIDSLRTDYRAHVTEVAEVKATHNATMRQVDQVMASYSQLHRLLVERLLALTPGRSCAPANEDQFPTPV